MQLNILVFPAIITNKNKERKKLRRYFVEKVHVESRKRTFPLQKSIAPISEDPV